MRRGAVVLAFFVALALALEDPPQVCAQVPDPCIHPVLSGYAATTFYYGIPWADAIEVRPDGSLLVGVEFPGTVPQGVYVAHEGDECDLGDAYAPPGPPFICPEGVALLGDGRVLVTDDGASVVWVIPSPGAAPQLLTSGIVNPYGIEVVPPGFVGTQVGPGDVIVCANGYGRPADFGVFVIAGDTGAVTKLAGWPEIDEGPLDASFGPDGMLYVFVNDDQQDGFTIYKVSPEGEVSLFLDDFNPHPGTTQRGGVAVHPVTGQVFFSDRDSQGRIYRASADGSEVDLLAVNAVVGDMEFDPTGAVLYAMDGGCGTVTAITQVPSGPNPPLIQIVNIDRGRDMWVNGEVGYHEYVGVTAVDADGAGDIASLTATCPSGEVRVAARGQSDWREVDPFTMYVTLWDPGTETPAAPGQYVVEVRDQAGYVDLLTSAAAPAISDQHPVLLYPPPANSVIDDTTPTFSWAGGLADSGYWLGIFEVSVGSIWEYWAGSATSADYNADGRAAQPALLPGHVYSWTIEAWTWHDPMVTDPRVNIYNASHAWGQFGVAQQPWPITGLDGKIVYERWEQIPSRLDTLDLTAAEPAPVSLDLDGYCPHGGMTWSSDGTKIAFSAFRPGEWEWGERDIYLVNADGTGLTNLTNEPGSHYAPNWSPEGEQILYSANPGFVPVPDSGSTGWGCDNNLYTIAVDGTERTQLTFFAGLTSTGEPVWSPDGTKIAFEHLQLGADCRADIAIINADGTGLSLLTDDPWWDSGPRWSPDGTTITFRSDRDGYNELYAMDADGGNVRRLTFYEGMVTGYYWAPDGQNLVVSLAPNTSELSWGNPNLEIYIIDATGGNPRRLTYNNWPDTNCAWAMPGGNTPPGSTISVSSGDITLTYDEVLREGWTTIAVTGNLPASAPDDLTFVNSFTYHISTTAEISGDITIAVDYSDTNYPPVLGERLRLLLWDGAQWVDITTTIDTAGCVVHGQFTPGTERDWFVALALDKPPVPKGKVVFSATTPGRPYGPGMMVADADFSNPMRLTTSLGVLARPECGIISSGCDFGEISPSGNRIAVSQNCRLSILDLGALLAHPGQEPVWLADESGTGLMGWGPSWSPDEEWLVFDGGWSDGSREAGPVGLYAVRPDGTDLHLLTPFTQPSGTNARWSPDGARIVYQQGSAPWERSHLWIAEVTGAEATDLRQLTTDPAFMELLPFWSPDGRKVVFERGPWADYHAGPGADLWIVDVTTGEGSRLTDTPDFPEMPLGWSPLDGYIYFLAAEGICRMLPDGTGREVVWAGGDLGCASKATWLSAGTWIDGLYALPGESVTAKLGAATSARLAGVQAQVLFGSLGMYSADLGESVLNWAMPGPVIQSGQASLLAYAADPETQSVSGVSHLFDLGLTNSPAAQPGDTQLLTFDSLLRSDEWGDPLEGPAFAGGVATIPFAHLGLSGVPPIVGADPQDPMPIPVTITAYDRQGWTMGSGDVDVQLHLYEGFGSWPWRLPSATPVSVALSAGEWSGEVFVTEPRPWQCLLASWEDIGGYSNWFQAIGKGDTNADNAVSIFDVVKIANMAIGRGSWTTWQLWAGDLNRDQEVNVFDVVICANKAMEGMAALSVGRSAVAAPTSAIAVTARTETVGSQVTVYVDLSNCAGLAGAQVELSYEAKRLKYSGLTRGGLLRSSWSSLDNDLGGTLKAITYTASGEVLTGGKGTLLAFTFSQIAKGAPKVELTSVKLSDAQGAPVPCQIGAVKGGGKGR